MEQKELVKVNMAQICAAKSLKYLDNINVDSNPPEWLQKLRKVRKGIVHGCSDGRYSRDLMNFLWRVSGDADLHLYNNHSGALAVSKKALVVEPGSTQKHDTIKQIQAAHLSMGYDIHIAVIHGPECKGACGRGLDVNRCLDEYATVPTVLTDLMPKLQVVTLFHNDKMGNCNDNRPFSLYEFHPTPWREARKRHPELNCLPGTTPAIAGLHT